MDMQVNEIELQDGGDRDTGMSAASSSPSVNYDDLAEVLQRIFSVVETYPDGGSAEWWTFLNNWDRRFVLNIYDMWMTTGKAPLTEKQAKKARVILRKMMTPSCTGVEVNNCSDRLYR